MHFPDYLVFFSDTGDGGHICFDRRTWQILEVYINKPNSIQEKKIANSFTDFLVLKFGSKK